MLFLLPPFVFCDGFFAEFFGSGFAELVVVEFLHVAFVEWHAF